MSIDYQAIAKAGGIGKGRSRKSLKARKDREDAKALRHFRNLVWCRERLNSGEDPEYALCQHCGAIVMRGRSVLLTGEVHHRMSRRHKETRYDPDNGVILCNNYVNNCHQLAELGRITV